MSKTLNRRDFMGLAATAGGAALLAACAPQVIEKEVQVEKVVEQTVVVEVEVEKEVEVVKEVEVEKVVEQTVIVEAEVIEIHFNSPMGAGELRRLQLEFDDAFDERHPEYTMKHTWGTWSEHNRMIPTWAAAGELADVIYVHGSRAFPWNYEGIAISQEPYTSIDEEFDVDGIWEEALNLYRFKGEVHEIPYDHGPCILGYNKDIFDEFGVDYPAEDWTMDDLLEAAIALTDPAKMRWGFFSDLGMNNDVSGSYLGPWGDQAINNEETEVMLGSDANLEAMQYWADMIHVHKCSPLPSESEGFPGGVWNSGVIAMTRFCPWSSLATYDAGVNYDVAPWPEKVRHWAGSFGSGYAITKDCEHPDAAWDYIRERFSVEGLNAVDARRGAPARKASYQAWYDAPATAEHAYYFEEAMATYGHTDHPFQTLGAGECLDLLNRECDLINSGDKTVEEAAAVMVEEGTAVLQEAYQRMVDEGKI